MIGPGNSLENSLAAFDIAGGSQAYDTAVESFRLEGERMIEGCYSIDLAERNMQFVGNEA
jgi:hypothetical protein